MHLTTKSSIISWWLEGLKLLMPAKLKSILNPAKKRILIRYQNDQLMIIWPNKKKNSKAWSDLYKLKEPEDRKELSKHLSKYTKENHNIALCIPADKGLRNKIKLPLSAKSELSNILDFEIDRQTPFSHDQVYSGFRLIDKKMASNSLNVELNVVPQKYVDPQLDILKGAGIIPQTVELVDDRPGPWVNVLSGPAVNDDHIGTRYLNKFLCLLGLLLFGIAIALPFRELEHAITQAENSIKEARAGALEVNELRSKWEKTHERQNSLNKMIDDHRSVTMILDELTRLIPDDTWLSRLDFKGETIRLQGESSSATSLIRLIENSSSFSGTHFQSPVTSSATTDNDRFQIKTNITQKVIPQVSSK